MLVSAMFDETLALNVANIAMAAVTLGLLAYVLAAAINGLLATRMARATALRPRAGRQLVGMLTPRETKPWKRLPIGTETRFGTHETASAR